MDADTRLRVIALEAVQHRYDDVVAIAELSLSVEGRKLKLLAAGE